MEVKPWGTGEGGVGPFVDGWIQSSESNAITVVFRKTCVFSDGGGEKREERKREGVTS